MIRIMGARGRIRNIDEFLKSIHLFSQHQQVCVQAMNAELVFGERHLVSAAEHAIRAFQQQRNTMNSLAMEILLYASGERQIKLGIQKMGVTKGSGMVAFVIVFGLKDIPEAQGTLSDHDIQGLLKTLQLVQDDKVLEGDRDTLQKFGITEQEIQTVSESKFGHLILEKVAMVDVLK